MSLTYSVLIRTLGTGAAKYQALLDSIRMQTVAPRHIYVVIPDGYDLPPEQLGTEEFLRCPKGMWIQRAYGMEYAAQQGDQDVLLLCDDDISFASDFVEKALSRMHASSIEVLHPRILKVSYRTPMLQRLSNCFIGSRFVLPSLKYAVRIAGTAGFCVCDRHKPAVRPTQSGTGACAFFLSEKVLEKHYMNEMWLDESTYALPDDQIMFYKAYIHGLRQYRDDTLNYKHLDHGSSDAARAQKAAFASGRNFIIFWHRFLYIPSQSVMQRVGLSLAITYRVLNHMIYYLLRGITWRNFNIAKCYWGGVKSALRYLRSTEYKSLPALSYNPAV